MSLDCFYFHRFNGLLLRFGFAADRQREGRHDGDDCNRVSRVHLSSPIAFSKSAFAVQNASSAFWYS